MIDIDRYERLKKLEKRVLLLEDSGFLEYLESKEGKSEKYAHPEPKDYHSSSLSDFNPPSPQIDTNKRIAELMATLQKKSEVKS